MPEANLPATALRPLPRMPQVVYTKRSAWGVQSCFSTDNGLGKRIFKTVILSPNSSCFVYEYPRHLVGEYDKNKNLKREAGEVKEFPAIVKL